MNELTLFLLCPPVTALAAYAFSKLSKNDGADAREIAREEEAQRAGAIIRKAVYLAYRSMVKQHAHGLWRLTACLSQEAPGRDQALYALKETAGELSRFNCKGIYEAINQIEAEEA